MLGWTRARAVVMARAALPIAGALALIAPAPAAKPVHAPAAPPASPTIPYDRLWDAQDGLVQTQIDTLQPRVAGQANLYAIAIAASGRQQLFSREAHLALEVAAEKFGGRYRGGLLLSNGAPDLLHAPLATRGNMIRAASGVAPRADHGEDILLVYLASHGSPDASLETDLPNLEDFRAISAASLAEALTQSGIKRRIIIVSACFSGSWIPALANDDTIIITAARSDRTSFGCDDTRRLTYFGQAFLEGPLAQGASLRDAFAAAQQQVAKWEAAQKFLPSEPQAFVGGNMQAVWLEGHAVAKRATTGRKVAGM